MPFHLRFFVERRRASASPGPTVALRRTLKQRQIARDLALGCSTALVGFALAYGGPNAAVRAYRAFRDVPEAERKGLVAETELRPGFWDVDTASITGSVAPSTR